MKCSNNLSYHQNHTRGQVFLCFMASIPSMRFQKKTQGQPKKTQGPFCAKNSTFRRLFQILQKILKKFRIQTTVFHGGSHLFGHFY